MRSETTERIEAYWGRNLPKPSGETTGVHLGAHRGLLNGYPGIYVVRRRDGVIVSAPADMLAVIMSAAPTEHQAMAASWWAGQLPGWAVLGPSVHAFLDDIAHLEWPGSAAPATPATHDQVRDALRDRVLGAEWTEAGFDQHDLEHCWLLRDRTGRPVAAANLSLFEGIPVDVGLVTAADSRGQGHGRAVACAAVRWAVEHHGLARWRALETNLASRSLCRALGFTDDCYQLAVHPGS